MRKTKQNTSWWKKTIAALLAASLALTVPFSLSQPDTPAYADPLSETKSELDKQLTELEDLKKQVDSLSQDAETSQRELDEMLAKIDSAQSRRAELSEDLAQYALFSYKYGRIGVTEMILGADTIQEVMKTIGYVDHMSNKAAKESREQKDLIAELNENYAATSEKKTELDSQIEELKAKKEEADKKTSELRAKVSSMEAVQKARLDNASGGGGGLTTFPTESTDGWRTGKATAYGGSTDSMTPNPSKTATGAVCNDWSCGVAVPMAWPGYRKYFGKKVEISYGGKSVIATVNDCGGMAGGKVSLDLQPGVFKAFGYNSCNSWGLRTVSYRFLD